MIYLIVSLVFVNYSIAKELLVGTTGDYPPLTLKTESGYTGEDIQIIKDFALSQGLPIKFIATSWPGLSKDLSENRFSVAVGGISENPARSKLFYLSDVINSSAKAPLIRCKDQAKFNKFADFDSESITVVENRGGTNQDFALSQIKHAKILLLAQNQQALAQLTVKNNPVDVMFTDDVEVLYRQKINPQLCLAQIKEQFPRTSKVFLFSKTKEGQQLQQKFNQWWQEHHTDYLLNKKN